MFVEGAGYISPKPISILLDEEEIRTTRKYAESLGTLRGYNVDRCFTGFLGEAALAKCILKETDIQRVANWELYDDKGDGGVDMNIAGITIQVKTKKEGKINQVQRYTDTFIPLESQFYTFCQLIDQTANYALVNINGWIGEDELKEQGRFHKHTSRDYWFIEIDSRFLYPISRLITRIKNESYKVSRQQRKISLYHR